MENALPSYFSQGIEALFSPSGSDPLDLSISPLLSSGNLSCFRMADEFFQSGRTSNLIREGHIYIRVSVKPRKTSTHFPLSGAKKTKKAGLGDRCGIEGLPAPRSPI